MMSADNDEGAGCGARPCLSGEPGSTLMDMSVSHPSSPKKGTHEKWPFTQLSSLESAVGSTVGQGLLSLRTILDRGAPINNTLSKVSRATLDRLIPPLCPVTHEPVDKPGLLSGPGWSRLSFIDAPFCPGCALPFSIDHGANIYCAQCVSDQHRFTQTRAAMVYNEDSHPLIVSFKHGDRTELAPLLCSLLARVARPLIREDTLLIPVPLHRRRLLARRYNQSALLARGVARQLGVDLAIGGLERHRSTAPQQKLSLEGRQRNVIGAFRLPARRAPDVRGRHVVLVDDVLTTGATLSACAKTLLAAGALQVDALVLARVVKGGGDAI